MLKITKDQLENLITDVINITVNNTEAQRNGCGIKVDYETIYKDTEIEKLLP